MTFPAFAVNLKLLSPAGSQSKMFIDLDSIKYLDNPKYGFSYMMVSIVTDKISGVESRFIQFFGINCIHKMVIMGDIQEYDSSNDYVAKIPSNYRKAVKIQPDTTIDVIRKAYCKE